MPIKIPNDLPAVQTLADENIFVMTETRAITQDIRPLKILLLLLGHGGIGVEPLGEVAHELHVVTAGCILLNGSHG